MPYHHGNLRHALLDAAVAIVREAGPDAVSVRQVARRAGVSSGAPFRHFENKAELMAAVADDGVGRLQATIATALAKAESTPEAQFRAMGIAYVMFAVDNPGHFRVMHRAAYTGRTASRRALGLARERMRAFIVAGQQAGTIRGGDPDAMILTAQALVYGVARLFVDGLFELEGVGDERAEEIADIVTAHLGSGFSTG